MTVHQANQRLARDLKLVVHDAEELLKATAGKTDEKVEAVRSRLVSSLDSAKATCDRLQDRSAEVVKATDHVIREHPYESIGIGFGAGLLIGALVMCR